MNINTDINTCLETTKDFHALATYAHLVPTIVVIFLAIYILRKTKISLRSTAFTLFVAFFSLWLLGDLVTWLSTNYDAVVLFWSQLDNINIIFFSLAAYFFATIVTEGDISIKQKLFLAVLTLPGFYITFTLGTVVNFDQASCNVINSDFLSYYKLIQEFICIAYIIILGIISFRKTSLREKRSQIILNILAFSLFLSVFAVTEFLASEYGGVTYTISLYGLFVLPIFLVMIIFSIVRQKLFDLRYIGTQLLVYVMIIMVATQFIFLENSTNKILNLITLLLSIGFGYLLIGNIKREERYRMTIENQAKELEKANASLKELDELKSQFLSFATHQVKAPMAVVKGYAGLIADGSFGPVNDKVKETAGKIVAAVNKLLELVANLLDMRKAEEGKMNYEFMDVDLVAMTKEVVNELKPVADNKKLELVFEAKLENAKIKADLQKFRQVILNFVDNSIKYTPAGWVKVEVLLDDKRPGNVLVKVSDSGLGMAAELLPKLFQQFSRDKEVGKKILGTGLGLFIAKQIVTDHGGEIWAESAGEGKGSQFYVSVPLVK